jgi:hypothetical protein
LAAVKTPFAARGIYEQHYQVARLVNEYLKQPVAVNDLGLVSYKSTNYVLDLFGLGSEQVRKARTAHVYDQEFIRKLANEHRVVAAIVYESWFQGLLPSSWTKVAVLETKAVTAESGQVSFFATDPRYVSQIRLALLKLKDTLPARSSLTLISD